MANSIINYPPALRKKDFTTNPSYWKFTWYEAYSALRVVGLDYRIEDNGDITSDGDIVFACHKRRGAGDEYHFWPHPRGKTLLECFLDLREAQRRAKLSVMNLGSGFACDPWESWRFTLPQMVSVLESKNLRWTRDPDGDIVELGKPDNILFRRLANDTYRLYAGVSTTVVGIIDHVKNPPKQPEPMASGLGFACKQWEEWRLTPTQTTAVLKEMQITWKRDDDGDIIRAEGDPRGPGQREILFRVVRNDNIVSYRLFQGPESDVTVPEIIAHIKNPPKQPEPPEPPPPINVDKLETLAKTLTLPSDVMTREFSYKEVYDVMEVTGLKWRIDNAENAVSDTDGSLIFKRWPNHNFTLFQPSNCSLDRPACIVFEHLNQIRAIQTKEQTELPKPMTTPPPSLVERLKLSADASIWRFTYDNVYTILGLTDLTWRIDEAENVVSAIDGSTIFKRYSPNRFALHNADDSQQPPSRPAAIVREQLLLIRALQLEKEQPMNDEQPTDENPIAMADNATKAIHPVAAEMPSAIAQTMTELKGVAAQVAKTAMYQRAMGVLMAQVNKAVIKAGLSETFVKSDLYKALSPVVVSATAMFLVNAYPQLPRRELVREIAAHGISAGALELVNPFLDDIMAMLMGAVTAATTMDPIDPTGEAKATLADSASA